MKIEWNKVTWYSKLLAVVLFVGVFILAFHLGREYEEIKMMGNREINTSKKYVNSNPDMQDDFTISVGEAQGSEGLGIKLNSIIEDSRCPKSVQCIWAGEVKVNVTFMDQYSDETKTSVLSSNGGVVTFEKFKIFVKDVSPSKNQKNILQKDYKVTFHVGL